MGNSEADKRSIMPPRPVLVGGHPTLCFIEDNDDNLILYEWINARYLPEYTFQLYSDGFFLQERFNSTASKPDLILLDLKMPHITGCELLTHLKEHPDWKHIPVVIFTHSTLPKDVEHCFAAGADGFINKEISVHGITAQLVEVCEHWLKYT